MVSKKKVAVKKVSTKKVSTKKVKSDDAPDQRAHIGKTTGIKLGEYWPKLFAENAKLHLSDAELTKKLKAEFPTSKQATEKMVRIHRGMYNRGQLGAQLKDGKPVPPSTRVPEYDAEHAALPFWGERSAAKKTKVKKEDRPDSVPFTKGTGAKKKVVRKKTASK